MTNGLPLSARNKSIAVLLIVKKTWQRLKHGGEDLFTVDATKLDNAARARFLVRKLDTAVHTKCVNHTLPAPELTFAGTVKVLTELFGPQMSQFSIRYHCLKLVRQASDMGKW